MIKKPGILDFFLIVEIENNNFKKIKICTTALSCKVLFCQDFEFGLVVLKTLKKTWKDPSPTSPLIKKTLEILIKRHACK